ncbi:MAG: hypothetical protein ACREKI_00930 [Gemmatimonadota bacterium]
MRSWIAWAVLAVVSTAGTAWAQFPERPPLGPPLSEGPPRAFAGGGLGLAVPVGEFQEFVNLGGGLGGFFLYNFDDRRIFGLRVDGGFIVYGSETTRRPLLPLIDVEVTTRNAIVMLDIGPQLTFPAGRVQPYVNATVGFSYFVTTSSVRGSSSTESFAETTNFDDFTFAWQSGTGLWITLSRGKNPVLLDLSARYVGNGRVRYLREGSIDENPDGSITITPIESETNLWFIQVGVAVGVG